MPRIEKYMITYYRVEKEKIWARGPVNAADKSSYYNGDQKYVTVTNLKTGDIWTVDMKPERAIYIATQPPEEEPHAMPGGIGI